MGRRHCIRARDRASGSRGVGPPTHSLSTRVESLDWSSIEQALDAYGYATTPALLTPEECAELVGIYSDASRFRSRIVMARHSFGSGEYQYFGRPLPALVETLRAALYSKLAPIANHWAEWLLTQPYPVDLDSFLDYCHRQGQTRPTPLVLKYEAGDYNCLHQDLYGDVAFPLQVTIMLSSLHNDFEGGEFLLLEQRPRAQSRGQAVVLDQGQAVLFATCYRPMKGARGHYRVNMRHGVSRLLAGQRYTLGIIFHDAR